MEISFFTEDLDFELDPTQQTKHWIKDVIYQEGYNLVGLNYIFCSDAYLLQINQQYLQHNTYTDIITFDNSEKPNQVEADIFISIERVKENSRLLNKTFEEELHRVMIHGVLHLIGFNDKTAPLKKEMRKKEDACLSLRH